MTIKVITSNCNFSRPYSVEELADSAVEIQFGFDRIISSQSKKKILDNLISEIQNELQKFEWLICGKVQLEIHWYLDSVERQETDKVGDLDNITKPLIDTLSGFKGIIVDDSQINSVHSTWISKNAALSHNFVRLILHFNNDWTVEKKNLYFLQTHQAIFTPLNFDMDSTENLAGIKLFIEASKFKRAVASSFKSTDTNVDRFLVYSEYEFHRTRLSGFDSKIILTMDEFEDICNKKGVDIVALLKSINPARS